MERPVDLSKLTGVLGNAKKIMAKDGGVSTTPSTGGGTSTNIDKDIPMATYQSKSTMGAKTFKTEAIKNSGLPAEIMESFLNKQIMVNGGGTNDDAVLAEINKTAGVATESTQPTAQPQAPQQVITEGGLVGVSEEKIREIVKEEMLKLFSGQVIKNVAEQVVKKVKRK